MCVAAHCAGLRRNATAAYTGRPTDPWEGSSCYRYPNAVYPSQLGSGGISTELPPSAFHWTRGYGLLLSPPTPNAPSAPP
jgi:hypothetical protein